MKHIIILGHARAGSTLLSALINWHSKVGPKPNYLKECSTINEFTNKIKDYNFHNRYAIYIERKHFFLDNLIKKNTGLTIGKELITEEVPSDFSINKMNEVLKRDLKEPYLLLKCPSLSFAVKTLPELFADYYLIILYRDPVGFVNSYKKRLGKKFNLKECADKWNETIEYLESIELKAYKTTYSKLLNNPQKTVTDILNYCDLEIEPYLYGIKTKSPTPTNLTQKELQRVFKETDKNVHLYGELL